MRIRSPFLKAQPRKVSPGRARSMPKRLTLVLILAAIIGTPIFIIVTRVLPPEPVGKYFYWLHDHVYLPAKGFTYTLFYPFSLSWWGPLATILVVWLVSYLMMISLTKDPHAQMLRRIVRRKNKHRLLLSTTRIIRKWKFDALLLQEITGQEREKALHGLTAMPISEADEETVDLLFHLTHLHIKLLTLRTPDPINYLRATVVWQQTYLQFNNRLARNTGHTLLKELTPALAEVMDTLLFPLMDHNDESQLKEAFETPGGFDTFSICLDLLYLSSLHNPPLADILYGDPDYPEETASIYKRALIIASRLADTTAQRREIIDRSRKILERIRKKELHGAGFIETEEKENCPLLLDDAQEIPYYCRIALSVSLDLAGMMGEAAIALDSVEAIEALEFEVNSMNPELFEEGFQQPLKDLPAPPDYYWCAELSREQLDAYEQAWSKLPVTEDSPLTPGDFQLARTRIRALYHAAGPAFDNS